MSTQKVWELFSLHAEDKITCYITDHAVVIV